MLHKIHHIYRIPKSILQRGETSFAATGICYNRGNNELFIADPKNRRVIVLQPETATCSLRPVLYKASVPLMPVSVCLMHQSETLLIANSRADLTHPIDLSLVSLSRDALLWRQQSQLNVSVNLLSSQLNCSLSSPKYIFCELADSSVLFGVTKHPSKQLILLKLAPDHRLTLQKELNTAEAYFCVSAAVINGLTIVALLTSVHSISMNRLLEDRLVHSNRLNFDTFVSSIIFSGDHLLLAEDESGCSRIKAADASRTPIKRAYLLLPLSVGMEVDIWCASGDRLCIVDAKSGDIISCSCAESRVDKQSTARFVLG